MTPDLLAVPCPRCLAAAGERCVDLQTRARRRPLPQPKPHTARLWPARRCPSCKALPGEPCRTPGGRIQPMPHTARRQPTRDEGIRAGAARAAGQPDAAAAQQLATASPLRTSPDAGDTPGPDPVEGDVKVVDPEPPGSLPRPATDFDAGAPALSRELVDLATSMAGYSDRAQAPNTTRAYTSDWRAFTTWARDRGLQPLPAEPATVALYLTALADQGLKLATVRRRASAITRAHRGASHPSPLDDTRVRAVLEGIARTHGAPPAKKVALERDALLAVIAAIDTTTPAGLRDRALLLVGFALALRRSELVSLCVEGLQPHPDGILVTLNRSKTDQHGRGHTFLLAHAQATEACPVAALRAWIANAQLTEGPIARRLSRTGSVLGPLTPQSVALIVRRRVEAADLPGTIASDFAGHSLRSGFATQAARDGYSTAQIRHVTRHRDPRTLDGYIQAGAGAKDLARVL